MASEKVMELSAQKTQKTRKAILLLAILSPLTAEVLSSSTPILLFLIPYVAVFQIAFYGFGALLIRETVYRLGLGRRSILLLGAAYGIFEEALINNTWFNTHWPDVLYLKQYGDFWGINWLWGENLTFFHAVISISIPIFLAEMIFPQFASRPWLSKRGIIAIAIVFGIDSAISLALFGFILYRGVGYSSPPFWQYLAILALCVLFIVLGLQKPRGSRKIRPVKPPKLWLLRLFGFFGSLFEIVSGGFFQPRIPALVAIIITACIYSCMAALIWRWSSAEGWGNRQILALSYGFLGLFLFIIAPIIEFIGHIGAKPTHGELLVAAVYILVLTYLSHREKQAARISVVPQNVIV